MVFFPKSKAPVGCSVLIHSVTILSKRALARQTLARTDIVCFVSPDKRFMGCIMSLSIIHVHADYMSSSEVLGTPYSIKDTDTDYGIN